MHSDIGPCHATDCRIGEVKYCCEPRLASGPGLVNLEKSEQNIPDNSRYQGSIKVRKVSIRSVASGRQLLGYCVEKLFWFVGTPFSCEKAYARAPSNQNFGMFFQSRALSCAVDFSVQSFSTQYTGSCHSRPNSNQHPSSCLRHSWQLA
jgi:hypothetical protein